MAAPAGGIGMLDVGDFGSWESDGHLSSSASDSFCTSHINIPNNTAVGLATKQSKKFSVQLPNDVEEEMLEEIRQSTASHDCNLSVLALTSVPSGLPLGTLTRLSLAENALSTIPEEIFTNLNCSQLVELDLNSNQLTSLPLSLFYLPLLEVLSINTNFITHLPFQQKPSAEKAADGRPFLPSVRRIGLEFNDLKEMPLEFLEWCSTLEQLLLGLNEGMLEKPISFERLQAIDRSPKNTLSVKVDNRPRFIQQMEAQTWSTVLPWLKVDLNKIYPDKVLDFLFLGSLRTAQTVTVYHDLDIGYVLTAGRDLEVRIDPGMKHLVLPVDDFPEQKMLAVFSEAFAFIDEARANKRGVLIHCFAGLSRSVTIAVAYIMQLKNISRDEALATVRKARPAARPNDGFLLELRSYEEILKQKRNKGCSDAKES